MLRDVQEGRGDSWEKEEGWTVGGEGRGMEGGTWVERKGGGEWGKKKVLLEMMWKKYEGGIKRERDERRRVMREG